MKQYPTGWFWVSGSGLLGEGSGQVAGNRQDSKVEERRLVYSSRCGRVMLNNVIVQNKGVDWDDESNIYWQHKVWHQSLLTAGTASLDCTSHAAQ